MTRLAGGLAAALLLGAVLFPGASSAGWVIASQSSTPEGKTFRDTEYFQRDKVRTESEGSAHVLDFARRRIVWIDTKEKKYSAMTFDEFRRMMRESMRKASAAKDGATRPVEEKKGEVLDSIRDRTKEGIKKLFKW